MTFATTTSTLTVLRAGHTYERATDWHGRRPPLSRKGDMGLAMKIGGMFQA